MATLIVPWEKLEPLKYDKIRVTTRLITDSSWVELKIFHKSQ